MTTRLDSSEIIKRVRYMLSDEDAEIFGAEEMASHLDEAVAEYSEYRPYMKSTSIATVLDQSIYNLPADLIYIDSVFLTSTDTDANETLVDLLEEISEGLSDYALDELAKSLRARYASTGQPVAVLWNNQLMLQPKSTASGDTIKVRYASLHAKNTAGNYPTLSIPGVRAVEKLTFARCMDVISTDTAKRGRYTQGLGQMDLSTSAGEFRRQARIARAEALSSLTSTMVAVG